MKLALWVLLISILAWYCFSPAALSSLRESEDTVQGFLRNVRVPSFLPTSRLLNILGPVAKGLASLIDRFTRPDHYGTHEVHGIHDKVEVITDKYGIPHVFGQSPPDVYFGQGYIHAHERLWQITFEDYLCEGRLSELFGEIALPTDTLMRLFGFMQKTRRYLRETNVTALGAVYDNSMSFLSGMNAYINNPKTVKPLEFTLLNLTLRNMTRENLICRTFILSWKMSGGWNAEVTRLMLTNQLGIDSDEWKELRDAYPHDNPTIMENPGEWNVLKGKDLFVKSVTPFLEQMGGSNSWAIHGKHTDTGNAMLCNDPHLPLQAPSMWIVNHLQSEDGSFSAAGVSIPGIPGVSIGHNGNISWGMTLSLVDISDLIVERLNPENANQYEYEGQWLDMNVIEETFAIKDKPAVTKSLKWTRNGPIISGELGLNVTIAFRSTLADQDLYLDLLKLIEVSNFEQFSRLLEKSPIPLNVVYADKEGNSGYKASGSCPIRAKGHGGDIAVGGWSKQYDWQGLVPPNEMPHGYNPEKGFYVTANNKLVDSSTYKYFLGQQWVSGFRANRITSIISEKLKAGGKFSIEELRKIQLDITSLAARKFASILKPLEAEVAAALPDALTRHVWRTLVNFDGVMDPKESAPSIYKISRVFLAHHMLVGALGESLVEQWLGFGHHPIVGNPNQLTDYDHISLMKMLTNESSVWVKRAGGKVKLLTEVIQDTTQWLVREFGSAVEHNADLSIKKILNWEWGNLHSVTARHVLGAVPLLGKVFSVGPYPIGGDSDTPMNTPGDLLHPKLTTKWYTHYRQCFDMGKLEEARIIQFPGQSGNRGSSHYDDYVEAWLKGGTVPLLWRKRDVIAALERQLLLIPGRYHELLFQTE